MKFKKCILVTASLVILALLAIPIYHLGLFMFSGVEAARENADKAECFINLPATEHERLISLSQNIGQGTYGDRDIDAAEVPAEFQAFGFYRLIVEDTQARAFLYSSFDSGGEAVVNWSNPDQPTINFVEGDNGNIITKVFPK